MRFFVVLFVMTICTGTHAATMCVPDLSTCTSCTNFSYSGIQWTANCCGVDVSGITLDDVAADNISVSFDEIVPSMAGGYLYRHVCFVLWPFVMPYGYVAGCDTSLYSTASLCGAIVPKCMVEKCSEEVVCDAGGYQ